MGKPGSGYLSRSHLPCEILRSIDLETLTGYAAFIPIKAHPYIIIKNNTIEDLYCAGSLPARHPLYTLGWTVWVITAQISYRFFIVLLKQLTVLFNWPSISLRFVGAGGTRS